MVLDCLVGGGPYLWNLWSGGCRKGSRVFNACFPYCWVCGKIISWSIWSTCKFCQRSFWYFRILLSHSLYTCKLKFLHIFLHWISSIYAYWLPYITKHVCFRHSLRIWLVWMYVDLFCSYVALSCYNDAGRLTRWTLYFYSHFVLFVCNLCFCFFTSRWVGILMYKEMTCQGLWWYVELPFKLCGGLFIAVLFSYN